METAERLDKLAEQLAADQKHLWAWWHEVCKLAVKRDGSELPSMPDHLAVVTHRLGNATWTLRDIAKNVRSVI